MQAQSQDSTCQGRNSNTKGKHKHKTSTKRPKLAKTQTHKDATIKLSLLSIPGQSCFAFVPYPNLQVCVCRSNSFFQRTLDQEATGLRTAKFLHMFFTHSPYQDRLHAVFCRLQFVSSSGRPMFPSRTIKRQLKVNPGYNREHRAQQSKEHTESSERTAEQTAENTAEARHSRT